MVLRGHDKRILIILAVALASGVGTIALGDDPEPPAKDKMDSDVETARQHAATILTAGEGGTLEDRIRRLQTAHAESESNGTKEELDRILDDLRKVASDTSTSVGLGKKMDETVDPDWTKLAVQRKFLESGHRYKVAGDKLERGPVTFNEKGLLDPGLYSFRSNEVEEGKPKVYYYLVGEGGKLGEDYALAEKQVFVGAQLGLTGPEATKRFEWGDRDRLTGNINLKETSASGHVTSIGWNAIRTETWEPDGRRNEPREEKQPYPIAAAFKLPGHSDWTVHQDGSLEYSDGKGPKRLLSGSDTDGYLPLGKGGEHSPNLNRARQLLDTGERMTTSQRSVTTPAESALLHAKIDSRRPGVPITDKSVVEMLEGFIQRYDLRASVESFLVDKEGAGVKTLQITRKGGGTYEYLLRGTTLSPPETPVVRPPPMPPPGPPPFPAP